ncbi:MAG: 1,2-phenylacetyl-CoA epoxidase subunit B [Bacteroidia bacterium]
MKEISFDPRVNRLNLPESEVSLSPMDNWQTYEVFHQKKRGEQHKHSGILHAPNGEMALVLAKEQFGRRGQTSNIWVVKSTDIFATSYDDTDMFSTTPEKVHREPGEYKVREKIAEYKKKKLNG